MKSKSLSRRLTVAVAAMACSMSALAQTHWGYEGEAGAQNWSKLDPKFAMCALGKKQSPIDISGFVEADLKPLKFTYARAHQTSSTTDIRSESTTHDLFAKTVGHPNNRPLNPVNARAVLK